MHGSVLRLSPPLVLTEEEARRGVEVLDAALADAASGGAGS
jgi:4-aminobutyrate aminotransferase-like enzyme